MRRAYKIHLNKPTALKVISVASAVALFSGNALLAGVPAQDVEAAVLTGFVCFVAWLILWYQGGVR